jgi:Gas vesicle synthesis protein GvpL/GvpF
VKIFWNPELELQAMLAENETLRSQRDGLSGRALSMDETIRMGQAIEQAMKQRQDAIAQTVREMLMPLAVEVRENDNINETMIFNTAYLIPWNSEPDFAAQVDAIDQRFAGQLTIRYNNFTAPYNFAMI